MAPRQVAVKLEFVGKIAGGCSSYDVIPPRPNLTWSIFFTKSCARFAPKVGTPKPGGAVFFAICEKPQGVAPPCRGKWGKTDQRGKTDHRLTGPNQQCYMLEYIIATFVLVCPSRAGHMVGLAGTVSELFAKILFFHETILPERSVDRKI